MQTLASRFIQESSLELHSFLNNPLAAALEYQLRDLDNRDGLGQNRAGIIPSHTTGASAGWSIKGPPHRWRYCTLKPPEDGVKVAVYPRAHTPSVDEIMRSLQDELFPSPAFRAWLAIVSRLLPLRYTVEARRFRPGLDYTLATSEDKEARLDVILGLVPPEKGLEQSTGSEESQLAQVGGWDVGVIFIPFISLSHVSFSAKCYMAPHDEDDDPAVYRSGSSKNKGKERQNDTAPSADDEQENGEQPADSPSVPNEDDEDESTLLSTQPGFNKLLLVLRDERVMRFVKYVSAAASGSRWDICGEYEVGMVEEGTSNNDDDDLESERT